MKPAIHVISLFLFTVAFLSACITEGEARTTARDPDTVTNLVFYPTSADVKVYIDEKNTVRTFIIQSVPNGADVYLDSVHLGRAPISINDFTPGTYRIRLVLPDYEEHEAFFTYEENTVIYRVTLARLAGSIDIAVMPDDARILLGGYEIEAGKYRVPAGSYELEFRKFGYLEQKREIKVLTDQTTAVRMELVKTAFDLSRISLSRTRMNPDAPGTFGKTGISFDVSAPGTGTLTITGSGGESAVSHAFEKFDTWHQVFYWNGRSDKGEALPDGEYALTLECTSIDGNVKKTERSVIVLDGKIVTAYRSVYCGVPGSLFSPGVAHLPEGIVQFGSMLAARPLENERGLSISAMPNISLRYGFTDDLEFSGFAGLVTTPTQDLPFIVSVSASYCFFRFDQFPSFAAGTYFRASYLSGSGDDSFSNFTGIACGLPFEVGLGSLTLVICPEVLASPWEVTGTDDGISEAGFHAWMYLRACVLIDIGEWAIGLSSAVRSTSFDRGFTFEVPVRSGFEFHYLVPGTQLYVSAYGIMNIGDTATPEFAGGIGLGFIY